MLITGGPSSSCEMIILRNNGHGGIIRVCMGIFTTALRNKKIHQILKKKKYLTLLPQRIACCLTAYFDEKSPFERIVHFEVFNLHKKSLFFLMYVGNLEMNNWRSPRSVFKLRRNAIILIMTFYVRRFQFGTAFLAFPKTSVLSKSTITGEKLV